MVDIGVATAWVAISAVSARGLAGLARAVATRNAAALAATCATGDGRPTDDGCYAVDALPRALGGLL